MLFPSIPVICRREILKETAGAQVMEVVCSLPNPPSRTIYVRERFMLESNRRSFLLWTRSRVHNGEIVVRELRTVTFAHWIDICTSLALIEVTARYTSLSNHEELLRHQTVKICGASHDETHAHTHLTSTHRSAVFWLPVPRTWFWMVWCTIYTVNNPHCHVRILLCLSVDNARDCWCSVVPRYTSRHFAYHWPDTTTTHTGTFLGTYMFFC
jgi:hypothetical protein